MFKFAIGSFKMSKFDFKQNLQCNVFNQLNDRKTFFEPRRLFETRLFSYATRREIYLTWFDLTLCLQFFLPKISSEDSSVFHLDFRIREYAARRHRPRSGWPVGFGVRPMYVFWTVVQPDTCWFPPDNRCCVPPACIAAIQEYRQYCNA